MHVRVWIHRVPSLDISLRAVWYSSIQYMCVYGMFGECSVTLVDVIQIPYVLLV